MRFLQVVPCCIFYQRCDGLLHRQSKVDPSVALDGSVVSASVIAAGSLKNSAVCDSRLCQLSYARARLCACQLCESLCVREVSVCMREGERERERGGGGGGGGGVMRGVIDRVWM
jgi:hypothetical protein